MDCRTTVYRRTDAAKFALKMRTSRAVLAEATTSFGTMAFHLRDMEDEKRARMGVIECAKHQLLYPHDPLACAAGTFVAQFLFTVLITPQGPLRLTPDLYDPALVQAQEAAAAMDALADDMKTLLSTAVRTKKKSKSKKKATTTTTA